jgi:hypothetical protein
MKDSHNSPEVARPKCVAYFASSKLTAAHQRFQIFGGLCSLWLRLASPGGKRLEHEIEVRP